MNKFFLTLGTLLTCFSTAGWADTNGQGYVTPTTLVLTITEVDLVRDDNHNDQVFPVSGGPSTMTATFNRADTDFNPTALSSSITFHEGKYVALRVCYNTDRSVKLNGNTYYGGNINGLVSGTSLLYSTGTNALTANSITTTASTAVLMPGLIVGNGTNNCSTTNFVKKNCISASGSACATDGTETVITAPTVTIVEDLMNSVAIDPNNLSLDNHLANYPYAVLTNATDVGTAGAALHMNSQGAGTFADVSLLYGTDGKLAFASSYSENGGVAGFCNGVPGVSLNDTTTVPPGQVFNGGITMVMSSDPFSGTTVKVQFVTGNCGTSSTCTSSGMLTLDNIKQVQGSTVNVTCPKDSLATPPFLGWVNATTGIGEYTDGAGQGASVAPFTLTRIVDPKNITTHCATSPCGTYPGF